MTCTPTKLPTTLRDKVIVMAFIAVVFGPIIYKLIKQIV